jgi:hypothetical protein
MIVEFIVSLEMAESLTKYEGALIETRIANAVMGAVPSKNFLGLRFRHNVIPDEDATSYVEKGRGLRL